jgi:SAM-dependent methyltransferase
MTESGIYDNEFYAGRHELTHASAQAVISALQKYVSPKSVVDLGCGVGTWLATFRKMGAVDILGLDGDYVNPEFLEIPRESFRPTDVSRPVHLDRQFDLAMSVEVAEHLPAQHAAIFVQTLSRLAPIVLFSAAIPFQGGVNHVNEQWPQYWSDLFEKEGFVCIDVLRRELWNHDAVLYWYRQNMLLFVRRESLREYPALEVAIRSYGGTPAALVHPESYLLKCSTPQSLASAAAGMVRAARRALGGVFSTRSPKG